METTADQPWVEVSVRVGPDDVDLVADVLREAGAEGVAIEPAILVSDAADFQYEELDEPSIVRATFPALAAGASRTSGSEPSAWSMRVRPASPAIRPEEAKTPLSFPSSPGNNFSVR